MNARLRLSRRRFLKASGWVAAGATVVFGCRLIPPLPYRKPPTRSQASGWVQVLPNGSVRLFSPRQEMGQGICAGLALIVAEELAVAPAQVHVVPISTTDIAEVRATVGSESISEYARPLALAAAGLREALARRAAKHLSVPVAALRTAQGAFVTARGQRVDYGQLAQGGPVIVDDIGTPTLRSFARASTQWVGTDVTPPHFEAIVTGKPLFAADQTLPGMAYGCMLRPPVLGGTIAKVSFERARAIDGFVAATIDADRNLIGVVATTPFALADICAAVAVAWELPTPFDSASIADAIDIDRTLQDGALEHTLIDESVAEQGPWDIDLRIDVPFAAHGTIEPRCAVARVSSERVDVWTGTQDPFYVRSVLARRLGIDDDAVVVHNQRMGGAFGSRTICTVELDAALLAKQAGVPVKVQWSRPDEFQRGFHRPPSSHRIRARLDRSGRVQAWWHAFTSGHVLFTSAALPPWLQTVTSLVADKGVGRGAVPPYALNQRRIEFSDVRLPIPTGPWRGLGAAPNTFVVETAMNQLARVAGRDPVQMRLMHLGPDRARLAACLKQAGKRIGWGQRRAGRGYGIACGRYKDVTDVAVAAEVERVAGQLRVVRMTCAQDCGMVFAPDQVRAQVEGNLLWGLGMALFEELPIGSGRVGADYFSESPLPTSLHLPAIEIDLLNSDRAAPTAAGESAIVAAAAAIANAVADLDDRQPTRLPIGGNRDPKFAPPDANRDTVRRRPA